MTNTNEFSAEDFEASANEYERTARLYTRDGHNFDEFSKKSRMARQAAAMKRELDEARSTIEKLCKTERQIIEHLRDNVTEKMKNAARRHYYLDDAFIAMLNAYLEELPK